MCESRAELRHSGVKQFLPELVKQCISVSFTNVMVGVLACPIFNSDLYT